MPAVEWQIGWEFIIACVGALILIGAAVYVTWRLVNPVAKKAMRIADFILGSPKDEFGPAKPSLAERLDVIDQRFDTQDAEIAAISAQVTPNHGSTSKLSEDVQTLLMGLSQLQLRFEDHIGRKP